MRAWQLLDAVAVVLYFGSCPLHGSCSMLQQLLDAVAVAPAFCSCSIPRLLLNAVAVPHTLAVAPSVLIL